MDRRLDRIDLRILAELQADGRLSNAALARRVHLSPTPCLERVRRLERDGFIRCYRAELDPGPVDLGLLVFVTVSIDRTSDEAFARFAAAIRKLDEVLECQMVAGGFDYLLKIRVRDMAKFRELLGRTLSEVPGIRETRSYVVMEEVKHAGALPLPPPEAVGRAGPRRRRGRRAPSRP